MLTVPTLSDDLIDGFHRDGFTFLPGSFGSAEMEQIERWATEVQNLPEISGKQWVYHEPSLNGSGEDLINRIEMISPFHAGFESLIDVLKAPVAQLLGAEAVLFKEKINFKMPGGDGFKPHRDAQVIDQSSAGSLARGQHVGMPFFQLEHLDPGAESEAQFREEN